MKSNTEIYHLCVKRRWDDITTCVERGEWQADTYVTDPSLGTKFSLLICAAQDGIESLAKTLLARGADPNSRITGAQTALMIACAAGQEPIIDLLVAAGADVHKKWRGETALMAAAQQNRKGVVRRLLGAGARVTDTDGKGRSALSHGNTRGSADAELIALLFDAGSPVDGRDLHVPVALREANIVRLLLSRRPNVNARFDWPSFGGAPVTKGDTPLLVAAGDTMTEALIKSGAPVGSLKASERMAIVELLVTAGADVNAQRLKTGWTPLLLATNSDEPEIVARLIQSGADPRQEVECQFARFPFSKPRTLTAKMVSAVALAQMRPRNKAVRKVLPEVS